MKPVGVVRGNNDVVGCSGVLRIVLVFWRVGDWFKLYSYDT